MQNVTRKGRGPAKWGGNPVMVNKYPGVCTLPSCGEHIDAGRGIVTRKPGEGWKLRHKPREWHGSPVSGRYINGCPWESRTCELTGWDAQLDQRIYEQNEQRRM